MHYSVTLLLMWVWSRWWWFSQCGCCPLKRSSRVDENSRSCTDVASYPAGRTFFFFLTPQTFPWERCWEQLSGKKWDETNKDDWPHYFWMMSRFLKDLLGDRGSWSFFLIYFLNCFDEQRQKNKALFTCWISARTFLVAEMAWDCGTSTHSHTVNINFIADY